MSRFGRPVQGANTGKHTVHAGLICLNGLSAINRAMQLAMLEAALVTFTGTDDLINQVIEVTLTREAYESAGHDGVRDDSCRVVRSRIVRFLQHATGSGV